MDERPAGPWLAVDLGERRIGIAISDPTGTVVRPLLILPARGRRHDVPAVAALVEREQVAGVVIGLPVREDGERTEATVQAERFAGSLRARVRIPIELHDERFSSWEARRRRIAAGRTGQSRVPDDAEAAAVILESFLHQ